MKVETETGRASVCLKLEVEKVKQAERAVRPSRALS